MKTEHLVFSLIQITHNLGSAFALGAPFFWLLYEPAAVKTRSILLLLALVWALQGISGGLFIIVALYLGAVPEYTTIGIAAIILKAAIVAVSVILCIWLLYRRQETVSRAVWIFLTALAAIATITAGILRWNT